MATSFVPMLMGLKTWARLENGRRVFDGYLGLWRIAFPDNYMYISFLPTIPQQVLRNKHFLCAYEHDSTQESLFVKSWPWGNPAWADQAFERGHSDFQHASFEVRERILAFLNDQ